VKSKHPYELTNHERMIAMRLSIGLSNKQIAADLGTSPYTIRDSLSAIFRKLQARNRVDAAVAFARLITLETTDPAMEIGEQSRVVLLAEKTHPRTTLHSSDGKNNLRELFETEVKEVQGGGNLVRPSDIAIVELLGRSCPSFDRQPVWALCRLSEMCRT
jgi:DNA-binding CsgD family transcriptional regulator